MNPAVCSSILLILLMLAFRRRRIKKVAAARRVMNDRKGKKTMLEMLERFVGKECVIYGIESQMSGTIRELRDGWIIVENSKGTEAVNAEFVTRVREYPRKKNGKKAVIID